MNFATLQGLTIPEGVVTQITDASGRVLWMAGGDPVVLEVSKITANTYAGETTYSNEKFILLDIYPKKNGTVKVTFRDLFTQTITDTSGAENPNAQQVFFGTFNGVTHSTTHSTTGGYITYDRGTLTIEGDYYAFALGSYKTSSSGTDYCRCITGVTSFGRVTQIPSYAFDNLMALKSITLPYSVTSIGDEAFAWCSALTSITIPNSVTSIGKEAFYYCNKLTSVTLSNRLTILANGVFRSCSKLTSITIPNSVTSIDTWAFGYCSSLTSITIPENVTSIAWRAFMGCSGLTSIKFANTSGWKAGKTSVDVTDPANNVTLLTSPYVESDWTRT